MSSFISALMAHIAAKPAVFGLIVTIAALVGAGYYMVAGPYPVLNTFRGQLTELGAASVPNEIKNNQQVAPETEDQEQILAKKAAQDAVMKPDQDAKVAKVPALLPSFDIVRVAASGEAVITGFSKPEERIEIVSNGQVIAQAQVSSSGDWAIVLDTALPPGGHSLIVRAVQPENGEITQSEQSVTVAILENPRETPIVLLDVPGHPGELLQGPNFTIQDDPPMEFDVAVATKDSPAVSKPMRKAEELEVAMNVPESRTDHREPELAADNGMPMVQSGEGALAGTASMSLDDKNVASDSDDKTALDSQSLAKDDAVAATQTTTISALDADTENEKRNLSAGEVAAVDASPNSTAPLLQETGPQQSAIPSIAPSNPSLPVPAPQNPNSFVTVEAVEAEEVGALYAAGASSPGSTIRVYFDGQLIGEATTGDEGRWLLEANRKLPAGKYAVRVEQITPSDGSVMARREVSFTRSQELVSLIPTAETEDTGAPDTNATSQSPSHVNQLPNAVIIRKGDNLWSISRRLYGSGTRYTTIYSANGSQIRNPALIYPGQVFILPK